MTKLQKDSIAILVIISLMLAIIVFVVPDFVFASSLTEEKVYCSATIEDEFESNTLLITLNQKATLNKKIYDEKDFSEVDCMAVEDLTAPTMKLLQKQILAEKTGNWNELKFHVKNSMLLNKDNVRRVLKITLKQDSKENVLNSIKILEKRADIISVEPNYIGQGDSVPSANYSEENQWGLNHSEFGIRAQQAWDITTGSNTILVGVIDSGINSNHPALTNRMYRATTHNIDTTLHRDYVDGTASVDFAVLNPTDPHGHGTKVAGVIGAQWNGSTNGAVGVCWDVRLVSLRVIEADKSFKYDGVISAISYATEQGISVLNFSGGGDDEYSYAQQTVICSYGGLLVVAAGNQNRNINPETHSTDPGNPRYPATYNFSKMITVGATVWDTDVVPNIERRAKAGDWVDGTKGSNFGQNSVDIFAPGTNIYTTSKNGGYTNDNGTSFAAPFVAGVAALMLSVNPNLTAQELKAGIMNNVDEVDALEGLCVSGGRLNAFKAVSSVAYDLTNVGTEEIQIDGLKNNLKSSITGELTISDEINGRTVTKIAGNAFAGSSISAINIPKAVNFINNTAFNSCANLSEITIESGNTVYMSQGNCIIRINDNTLIVGCKTSVIPSTVTSIGNNAFYGCSGLTGITIPNSVSSIGDLVFADCTSLGSISIPNNVNNIGSNTFSGCSNLSSVSLPVGLTSISWGMFKNCSKLSNISIPSSVTAIGQNAFYGCSELSSISIPSAVNSIGSYAFFGCSGLTGFISLPNNVTNIADYTFKDCSKIMGISGANLTLIGSSAFENCTSLIGFLVPESTTGIGIEAFKNCTSLSILTIKSNLLGLGDYAFKGCSSLTSVVIPTGVEYMGVGVFDNCNYLTIYTSYASAPSGWSSNSGLSPIIGGSDWNIDSRPVFWGCTLMTTSGVPYVYSITLNAIAINGGRIENANAINGISAPTRAGYTFGGWYNNANFTGTAISATGIANYLTGTFYVKWTSSGGILPILSDVEQYELTLEEIAIILGVNLEEENY